MDVSEGATELHGWLVTKDSLVSCLCTDHTLQLQHKAAHFSRRSLQHHCSVTSLQCDYSIVNGTKKVVTRKYLQHFTMSNA